MGIYIERQDKRTRENVVWIRVGKSMHLLSRISFLKAKIKLLKIAHIHKLNIIYNVTNSHNFPNSSLPIKLFIFLRRNFPFL